MTHEDALVFWLTSIEIDIWFGLIALGLFIVIGGIVWIISAQREKKRMKMLNAKLEKINQIKGN